MAREDADWVDVVVVTEDSAFGRLLNYGFTAKGSTCQVLESGSDVSRAIQKHAPKVIVLDLFMAVNDGFKLLHWVSELGADAIPTLVLTTSAQRTMTVEIMVAGASDVFVKPVTFPTVLDRVRQLMAESPVLRNERVSGKNR